MSFSTTWRSVAGVAVLSLALGSILHQNAAAEPSSPDEASASAAGARGEPAGVPSPGPSSPDDGEAQRANPYLESLMPASDRFRFRARVTERLEAGHYTYWHLREAGGQSRWVVSLDLGASPTGEWVEAFVVGSAAPFRSSRLDREFDWLGFAVVRASE